MKDLSHNVFIVIYFYCFSEENRLNTGLFLTGLVGLESVNLSFTAITDNGLRKLSGLSSLRSLNLDTRQITDSGLATLTSKYT